MTCLTDGDTLYVNDVSKEKPYDESKVFAMNVAQGKLLYRADGKQIVYADGTEPLVKFFDSDLQEIKVVHGPVDYKVEYMEMANELAFSSTYCTSYLSACGDDENVYLLYEGQERDIYDDDVDWDGNLVESYVLKGGTFASPTLSAGTEPGTFYMSTIFPDKENLQILYYDLNKVSR